MPNRSTDNQDNVNNKVGTALFKYVVTITSIAATLVGGILWLGNIANTANAAFSMSKENAVRIEVLVTDINSVKITLGEIRSDLKYIISQLGTPRSSSTATKAGDKN